MSAEMTKQDYIIATKHAIIRWQLRYSSISYSKVINAKAQAACRMMLEHHQRELAKLNA